MIKKWIKRYRARVIALLFTVFMIAGLAQQWVTLTVYHVTSPAIPQAFDGYRIAHITDFHSGLHNISPEDVIALTAKQNPHIICLTGDIVDGRIQNYATVEELIAGLTDIAPVYAVSGNNEFREPSINIKMGEIYKKYGVQDMDGKTIAIYDGSGASFTLSGIADSRGQSVWLDREVASLRYNSDKEGFGVILYHRANDYDIIAASGYELVLSGHLHGGLIRLPFLGGLLSPDYEVFPPYAGGLYEAGGRYLVSSRGIGNNQPIPRFYNPPEVALVVLRAAG
jgi:predicted MPP superfamily phosphohydrolase